MKTRGNVTNVRLKMDSVKCCWCHRPHKDLRALWPGHATKNKKENYGQLMIQCFDFNAAEWKQSKRNERICPSCAKRLRDAVHLKLKLFGVSIRTEEDDIDPRVNNFVPNESVDKDQERMNIKEADTITDGTPTNDPFDTDNVSLKEEHDSGNEDGTPALVETLPDYLVDIKDEEHLDEELLMGIKGANINGHFKGVTCTNSTEFTKTPYLQSENTGFVQFDQPEHLKEVHWEEYQSDDQRANDEQSRRSKSVTSKRRMKKMKTNQPKIRTVSGNYYKPEELTTLLKLTNATPFTSVLSDGVQQLACVYCKLIAGKSPAFGDADEFRRHVHTEHDAVRLGLVRRFTRVTKTNMCVDIMDFRCTWCDVSLPSWQLMLKHLSDVHDVTKLHSLNTGVFPYTLPRGELRGIKCALCTRVTHTLQQQLKHTRTHYFKHKCDKCTRCYKYETDLRAHATACDGRTYRCDTHTRVDHTHTNVNKCVYCDKQCRDIHQLQDHMFQDHIYLGFKCTGCFRRTFRLTNAYLDHYQLCHNRGIDVRGPDKECVQCKHKYRRENLYKVNGSGENMCNDCFKNTRQTVFHNGDRVGYKCHVCESNHTNEASLSLHWTELHLKDWLKTTGFEKLPLIPVKCFKNRRQHGDYIECNVCKSYFNLNYCLKMFDNDSEVAEYLCKLCFIETRQTDYLHGVKVGYKCHYCGRKAKKRDNINRHYFRLHRKEWLKTSGHLNLLDPFRDRGTHHVIHTSNMSHKSIQIQHVTQAYEPNSNTDDSNTTKTITLEKEKQTKKEQSILIEHNYCVVKCNSCHYKGPMEGMSDHYKRNHYHDYNKENTQCFKCKIKYGLKKLFQINGTERRINICDDCFVSTRQSEYVNGVRIGLDCFKCHICGCKCKLKTSLYDHYNREHRSEWCAMSGLRDKPAGTRQRKRVNYISKEAQPKRRSLNPECPNGPDSKGNKEKPSVLVARSTKPQHISQLRVYSK